MAVYLRRAISNRNTILVLRSGSSALQSPQNWCRTLCSPNYGTSGTQYNDSTPLSSLDFLRHSRRGFAKAKRSKDDSAGPSTVEVVDIGPIVKETAVSQMEAAIVALSRELTKLRTGRASPGMLDHIIVETGGVKMPLNHLAVVSVLDPKTLSINPYDPNTLKELESAIVSSPLGLNPKADGQRLIAAIPPLTKEHIQAMCKVVAKTSEDVKQSIRRARQKALDTMKKAGSNFPKDEAKRLEKEVDELTKKYVKSAEDLCKAKEKEITEG
ncbi:Ribosome recycling factor [Melia azedarach]|uniref:Ribosome recycling factor n=1 Tax=Melia azedarach TaxID=155640 RepID=A0ACC1Z0B0_MELAZ|nr:Ribosome recycling factor [Melia azedarach]